MSEADEQHYDDDGMPLLSALEVAKLAGVEVNTVRVYNSTANRARRAGKDTGLLLPAPRARVLRPVVRDDGRRMRVWAPVWREDQVQQWLKRARVRPLPSPDTVSQEAAPPVPAREVVYRALRDHAEPDGTVLLRSVPEVAAWCGGMSVTTVYVALAELEAAGRVEWRRGSGAGGPSIRLLNASEAEVPA